MEKLRIGVLGIGAIIREFQLPAVLQHPGAELVAAAETFDHALLERVAGDFKIPKTYTDFEAMAQDPNVDAVINGLPNHLHASVSIQMLKAGKHVLCEKPMALTIPEGEAMIAAARAAHRKLMIAYVWRSDYEIRWLRDIIQKGHLGQIYRFMGHATALGWGPTPNTWRTEKKFTGGGAFLDVGSHSVDQISFLLGDEVRPRRVFARMSNVFEKMQVEDTAMVMIEYDNGAVAVVDAGWYHPHAFGLHGGFEIFGTKGHARMFPSELHCSIEGLKGEFKQLPPRQGHIELPMYADQIKYFLECIEKDTEPICGGIHGLQDLVIMDAAYRSAQSGQAVEI